MVHLFSRVSRLLARVSKHGEFLDESASAASSKTHPDGLVHIDSVGTGLLPAGVLPPIFQPQSRKKNDDENDSSSEVIDKAELQAEAARLERDIDAWIESLQVCALEHERVQVGNRAYAYAMKVGKINIHFVAYL